MVEFVKVTEILTLIIFSIGVLGVLLHALSYTYGNNPERAMGGMKSFGLSIIFSLMAAGLLNTSIFSTEEPNLSALSKERAELKVEAMGLDNQSIFKSQYTCSLLDGNSGERFEKTFSDQDDAKEFCDSFNGPYGVVVDYSKHGGKNIIHNIAY